MKKWIALSVGALLSVAVAFPVAAKPVKTEAQAFELVKASIKKNKLRGADSFECVIFLSSDEDGKFRFDLHEDHNDKCGGDPNFAPRMYSYEVNKKTGKLCTDNWQYAEKMKKDPTDMECLPIK